MAGFDLEMQHGGQMAGGIKVECGDVSFGAGDTSVALPTRLTTLYAGSVNVIAGDNTVGINIGVAADVSNSYVTLKRLGAADGTAGNYMYILMGV